MSQVKEQAGKSQEAGQLLQERRASHDGATILGTGFRSCGSGSRLLR